MASAKRVIDWLSVVAADDELEFSVRAADMRRKLNNPRERGLTADEQAEKNAIENDYERRYGEEVSWD